MALVQAKNLLRVGLAERVSRYVSPPQPGSSGSFLWKSDSLSRRRRSLLLAQAAEIRTCLFSTTAAQVGAVASEEEARSPQQPSPSAPEEAEISSVTDADVLDRSYGHEQRDPHKVANESHESFKNRDDEHESLESTGFDISKMSRPVGDE